MKLFINYRREDTDDLAGRLHDRLSAEFGSENIFKDVDSIRPGQNWKAVLEQSVGNCDVVIALIGKHWISCVDRSGQRRLLSEEDWVRFELEAANRMQRIIMPISVKGAPVPAIDELPPSLRWLPDLHVIEIRGDPYFKDDVARLINELRRMRDRLAEQPRLVSQSAPAMPVGVDSSAGSIVCPNCKRMSPRSDQFCEGCGAGLWDICPRCSLPIPAAQRFCKNCGADVPKAKQADQAFEQGRARLNEIALNLDAASRHARACTLLRDLDPALRSAPDHAQLRDLKRQVLKLAAEGALEAAATEFRANRFGKARQFYERLEALEPSNEEAIARIRFIQGHHDRKLGEIKDLIARGRHKQAIAALEPLQTEFSDDAQVNELLSQCRQVLDRATQLLTSGLRNLQAQRRLIALEREIAWLESQKIRATNLPELAAATREKIAAANATIAKAASELRAGNVKGARQMARVVVDNIADHDEAITLAQSSTGVVDQMAQLEQCVELKQWCAAGDLMRELEAKLGAEPTLAKLKAKTKAGIAELDFKIWLFAALLAVAIAGWYFAVPWLENTITLPSGAGENFIAYAWIGGSALLLSLTWWLFENKSQILRRVLSRVYRGVARLFGSRRLQFLPSTSAPVVGEPVADGSSASRIVIPGLDISASGSDSGAPQPVAPLVAPSSGAAAPSELESSQVLSATQVLQRLESTAVALEWLLLGGLGISLGAIAARWLSRSVDRDWLGIPLVFGIMAIAIVPFALYVGGFSRWRLDLAAAAAGTVLCLGTCLVFPIGVSLLAAYCLGGLYAGLISASVNKVRLPQGAAATLLGPLVGALIASPVVFLFAFLASRALPESWRDSAATENHIIPLTAAAVIWCMLIVTVSTSSETLVRYFVVDRPRIRGVFALAVAFATAAGLVSLVTMFGSVLNDKMLSLTSWIVFLAVSQVVPPFLRWRWRSGFSIFVAGAGLATVVTVALAAWVAPGAALIIATWVVLWSATTLIDVKTVDVFTHKADLLRCLRSRVRMRRLPVRISVSRS